MTKPRLLDRVRDAIRSRHYSLRTEQAYIFWVRRFILFHRKRHPETMGESEITEFLTHLAVARKVAASTQNQALSAILFLYKHVLDRELDRLDGVTRAKRPQRLPVVLSQDEVRNLLAALSGVNALVARLLYGTGMRKMESLRLRVKDVDFSYRQCVRSGKGDKDRVTLLPDILVDELREQLDAASLLHQQDLEAGYGEVSLPYACQKNIPMRAGNGSGNLSFRQPGALLTPTRVSSAGITGIKPMCSGQSSRPRIPWESASRSAYTHYATPLPLIYSRTVMTFAPYRICWAIRMFPRP
jgi:integrase